MTLLLTAVIAVATAAGVGMIAPQVLRLRRVGSVEGVSPQWIGVGVAMNSWWSVYATATSAWGLIPVGVLAVILYGELGRRYVGLTHLHSVRAMAKGAAVFGLVPVPFMAVAGWPGVGLAIGLCYGAAFVPATVEAYRSTDLTAIAPLTWALAWIEAAIWFGYGMTRFDPALLVGGGGGTIMSTALLVRLATHHGAGRRPPSAVVGQSRATRSEPQLSR